MSTTAWPIGVRIPALNCRDRPPAHLERLRQWSDRVAQVVVVDSESTNGTLEHVRDHLRHAQLSVLSRPPGLFES
jgi:hypothetical protein